MPGRDARARREGDELRGLRDAGDPVELARRYCDEGADELVFLDITATSDRRQTAAALASHVAEAVNIPFTIGGGVRSVGDAGRCSTPGPTRCPSIPRPSPIRRCWRP